MSDSPTPEAQDKWKALIGKWQQRAEAAGYDGIEGALEAAEAQAQGGGDVCEVCDGGPGNDGPCLCGLNAPTSAPVEGSEVTAEQKIELVRQGWTAPNPPPSAPVEVEGFDEWFDEYTKNNYTDEMLAEAAWKAALAQQPAAVDGATLRQALHAMKRCQREAGGRQWEPWIAKVAAALSAPPAAGSVPEGYIQIGIPMLRELIGDERMAEIEAACRFHDQLR